MVILMAVCLFGFLLFGCTRNKSSESVINNKKNITQQVTDETELVTDSEAGDENVELTSNQFQAPGIEKLTYTLKNYQVYNNLDELGISIDNMEFPDTYYPDNDIFFKDWKDYVDESGNIINDHSFLVFEMEAHNIDATGLSRKNEFVVNFFSVIQEGVKEAREQQDENMEQKYIRYIPAYFSLYNEEASADSEPGYFHYQLDKGEKKTFKLGYFVRNEDLKDGHLYLWGGGAYELKF